MTTVEQIIEQLKTLTLIESSELVKQIEETFGVDASAPVGGAVMMMGQESAAQEVVEETPTFDVRVVAIPDADKRVGVLKVLRKITSLGLAEAKEFTVSLPKILKEGVFKEEAEEAKNALEAAGATVELV
jgi:large subunit ribosomal protein L7/L12|uniref:Large ribosomal subunit protein bL12c n=1 Tax=Ulothrix zonata TaxID=43941 RepID=A0A2Z4MA39_9CHLO|nr:ribosomal protein L12 [Ulothrix zonata]